MSKDNFEIGIVNYICPICAKVVDNAIIMNKYFTKKDADKIREINGKTIGYAENACEECFSYKDEVIYVIEIDSKKSKPNNPYRTGKYWGISKNFSLFIDHPEYILITKNGVKFCFMDKELTFQIGLYAKKEENI